MNLSTEVLVRVTNLVPLVLSLSVHEWAHALAATALGDTTAKDQGRLTLNPVAHVDLVGTIALPLLGIPFGWAKPVPVEPTRFRRDVSMNGGMLVTALAGPLSNLLLLALCAGLGFVPLVWEKFDLLMRQRDYFRDAMQRVVRIIGSSAMQARAREMGGYDLTSTGEVRHVP